MPAVYIARNLCKFQSNFPGDGVNRMFIYYILYVIIFILYLYIYVVRLHDGGSMRALQFFFLKFYRESLNCNKFKYIQRFVQ